MIQLGPAACDPIKPQRTILCLGYSGISPCHCYQIVEVAASNPQDHFHCKESARE